MMQLPSTQGVAASAPLNRRSPGVAVIAQTNRWLLLTRNFGDAWSLTDNYTGRHIYAGDTPQEAAHFYEHVASIEEAHPNWPLDAVLQETFDTYQPLPAQKDQNS